MSQTRSEYLSFRRKFEPARAELVIVAESPPVGGKYFYDPAGKASEPLFAALMQQLGVAPTSKEEGLQKFQQSGWVLVDATYEQVNDDRSERAKAETITRDYPLLREDLDAMLPDRSTPIVLVKANVCRLLEHRLRADGFRVLNDGRVVYFPSHGRQPKFHEQFGAVLKPAV